MSGQPYITTPSGRRIRVGNKKTGKLLCKQAPLYTVTVISRCEWASPEVPSVSVREGNSVMIPLEYTMGADWTCVSAAGATVTKDGVVVDFVTRNTTIILVPAKEPYTITFETTCPWAEPSVSSVRTFGGTSAIIPIVYSDDADDSTITTSNGIIDNGSIVIESIESDMAVTLSPAKVQIAPSIDTDKILAVMPSITYASPGETAEFTVTYAEGYGDSDVSVENGTFNGDTMSITASTVEWIMAPVISDAGTLIELDVGRYDTANKFVPTYTWYKYSITEEIYPADDISAAGYILSLSYNVTKSVSRVHTVEIYMIESQKRYFTGTTDWIIPEESNRVYSGDADFTSTGWHTFNLSKPFHYTRNGSLVIMVVDISGHYEGEPGFAVYNTTSASALYRYNDNTQYSPFSPPESNTPLTVRNQLKMVLSPANPMQAMSDPLNIQVRNIGPNRLDTIPTYTNYKYSISEQIFLASEIGLPGTITGIAFYLASGVDTSNKSNRLISVYMSHTDKTTFADSSDWVPMSAANKVANTVAVCKINGSDGGWVRIEFDTAFIYDGVHNLIVMVDDNTGAWTSKILSFCSDFTTDSSKRAIYRYDDSNDFSPENPASGSSSYSAYIGSTNVIQLRMARPNLIRGNGDVTVGTAPSTNSSSYYPTNVLYSYSYSQMLYLPDDINRYGKITKIALYSQGNSATRQFDIYMCHVSKTKFASNTDFVRLPVNYDGLRVFSGEVNFRYNEWVEITLDAPFDYNGTQPLWIGFNDLTGSAGGGGFLCAMMKKSAQGILALTISRNSSAFTPSDNLNSSSYTYDAKNSSQESAPSIRFTFEGNPT